MQGSRYLDCFEWRKDPKDEHWVMNDTDFLARAKGGFEAEELENKERKVELGILH